MEALLALLFATTVATFVLIGLNSKAIDRLEIKLNKSKYELDVEIANTRHDLKGEVRELRDRISKLEYPPKFKIGDQIGPYIVSSIEFFKGGCFYEWNYYGVKEGGGPVYLNSIIEFNDKREKSKENIKRRK